MDMLRKAVIVSVHGVGFEPGGKKSAVGWICGKVDFEPKMNN